MSDVYAHLSEHDVQVLRWAVRQGSGCMWLTDTPRTSIRGLKHHVITCGNPVRTPLHRLSREDTELVDECICKDVARGQLKRGSSPWGAPAFITKAPNRVKSIQRGRRLVVDYRQLNRVTVRKVFLIPNRDYIKSCAAGSDLISVGDLKEGFIQEKYLEKPNQKFIKKYMKIGRQNGTKMIPKATKRRRRFQAQGFQN